MNLSLLVCAREIWDVRVIFVVMSKLLKFKISGCLPSLDLPLHITPQHRSQGLCCFLVCRKTGRSFGPMIGTWYH